MVMRIERIVDDTGWSFMMPKIDYKIIKKYDLGTWDLADWTFGTPAALFQVWFWDLSHEQFSRLTTILWRLENKLRLKFWLHFFHGHHIRAAIYNCIRQIIFKIGWKLALHDLGV